MSWTLVAVLLSDNWRLSIIGSPGPGVGFARYGVGILAVSPKAGCLFPGKVTMELNIHTKSVWGPEGGLLIITRNTLSASQELTAIPFLGT